MNMRVHEFAKFTGVSVRTLHYYDEIGLLKPARVDKSTGYRFYDEDSFLRMQEILFYRELDFSLKRIGEILSSPNHNRNESLRDQQALLTLKKERLERLIAAIDGALKGDDIMSAFDNSEWEQYREESKEKWGKTDAYREYEAKGYTKENQAEIAKGMESILAEFAACMKAGKVPDSVDAQGLVKRLQEHISEHYYHCTDEILEGLGQMYIADERFTKNINQHADGTAMFMSEAIDAYCKMKRENVFTEMIEG